MSITDNSYDYLKKAIDAFDMLDANARRALFGELRGMLSTVLSIQTKNEEFKQKYYKYYALLEDGNKKHEAQIEWLEAENARLQTELDEAKVAPRQATVHVIRPVLSGEQRALQG